MDKIELKTLKAIKAMKRLLMAMESKPPIVCNSFNEVTFCKLASLLLAKLLDSYLSQPTDPTLLTWGDYKPLSFLGCAYKDGACECQVFEQPAGDSPSSSLQAR